MKLSEQIRQRPFFVAFGASSQSGGLTSVDLAAAHDETRVILTASDGSAAPVAGADAESAGVMTAADKVRLDNLPPTTTRELASRSEVGATVVGAMITHLRTAGYAATGDGGAALYRRVAAEPAHNLKVQSGDGAWWELVADAGGYVSVRQAGAKGDGLADDGQAFRDVLDFASFGDDSRNVSTHGVVVPPGEYYLGATTLELKKQVSLVGSGSGFPGPRQAKLLWDANVTGIIVHMDDTIGAATEPVSTTGRGSRIEGLELRSAGGTIAGVTDDTRGHGIWLRGAAALRDLRILDFPGNGINIVATAGVSAATDGNANNWRIDTVRSARCHLNGLYVDGNNCNAGVAVNLDCSSNGRWGVWDSSFLGNTYVGCHTQSNGLADDGENGGAETSVVHYKGPENGNTDRRYAANVDATEAELASTVPGTDEGVWLDIGPGGASSATPSWQTGQPEGTYFHGGAYRTDDPNADNLLLGCYVEPGQGPGQYSLPTIVVGGVDQYRSKGSFVHLLGNASEGRFSVRGALVLDGAAGSSIFFRKGGENTWVFDSDNHLRPAGYDNVFDLGSASFRLRDGYLGGKLSVGQGCRTPLATPAQISANETDYDGGPGGFWKLTADGAYAIEGIAGGEDGRELKIVSASNSSLTFKHASATTDPTNRIFFSELADVVLNKHEMIWLIYDDDAGVWRGGRI